ncbi:MAG: hypothetical protein F2663_09625 [Actinobacteria bacterium]|uniref:Unannotated protein n=1 Tax=freshwater metagenome TaxID=449393 RepID=A0A6J6QGZ9_9ZZZZ|nr:hypothetical protein [Actinomycetota bacterium]
MIAPRVLAVTGAAVALLLVGVIVGKHEGSTANAKQIAEISSIKQLVGDRLDSPTLAAFRFNPGFACLIYRVDTNRFALRLCFDGKGRLVETADLRTGSPVYGSVTYEPSLAPFRVAPERIIAILRRHGVTDGDILASGY